MNIFIDENIPYLAESLENCGTIVEFKGRELTKKELIEGGCEYLFIRSPTKITRDLLDETKVKFVGTATSGIDHVDVDYLEKRGVQFAYAPGSNANSVAEYTIYALLKWAKEKNIDIRKKKIGVIGYGNIGSIVAKYAHWLGMKVLVNDPPLQEENFQFPNWVEYLDLPAICRVANVNTNHVPLTFTGKHPTHNLLNEELIKSAPKDSLFIHASRRGVVNEKALLKRLQNGEISAAIDAWENEPIINTELARRAFIATPHVAGYSRDGKLRGVVQMAQAFEKFSGEKANLQRPLDELSSYKPTKKEDFADPERIYETLKRNRKIDDDSQALKETLTLTDNERGKAFDSLRKNYPVKRESL